MLRRAIDWTLTLAALAALAACAAPTPAAGPVPATAASGSSAQTAPPAPTATAAEKVLRWDAPPPMAIDPAGHYLATFETANGKFEIELLPQYAPVTVNNFVFLARQGYYDGTTFHRVLEDFMAQGGDPTGTGSGGPGYQFQDEFEPALRFEGEGWLAMANSGPATNGSQFFITFAPTPHLNDRHTIFGKVVAGMEVVKAIRLRDPSTNPDYPGETLIRVTISEIPETRLASLPTPMPTPEPRAPAPADGRPLAGLDPAARADLYNTAPEMVIDTAAAYTATLTTSRGEIVVQLHAAQSPLSVNNFIILAGLGYWDDFPVNFVEAGHFALSGSPAGRPDSDIGYTLPVEAALPNTAGSLGYWFRDDRLASSGSEIYLLLVDDARLDGRFSVFGTVLSGLEVAQALTAEDRIETITVEGPLP